MLSTALTACRRTVSGTLSLPSQGCFSPFPHGTCSLSVSGECLALADGPAGFTRGYTCPALLRITPRFGGAPDKGLSPSAAGLSRPFSSLASCFFGGPTTPPRPEPQRFGLFPVRSPLLGKSFLFSLPAGTKMFQFPAFASDIHRMTGLQPAGLSHSEISGSKVICTSPKLIAAYHVLHRL